MRKNRKDSVQNHYRLLVLDDDEMITLALRAYFEGCGYQVDIESNPLQAIERIRQGDYDILLLDFLMTPICGDQVVEQIRQFNHDLFIILLTGHKDLAPPVKTIREVLDIALIKPQKEEHPSGIWAGGEPAAEQSSVRI